MKHGMQFVKLIFNTCAAQVKRYDWNIGTTKPQNDDEMNNKKFGVDGSCPRRVISHDQTAETLHLEG
jgi:hypothetical protein